MDYIPLKRATLLGRLTALLGLETLNAPPRMALWPGVLPVLSLEGLLRLSTLVSKNIDLSPAVGTYVVGYTVPVGKRWKLVCVSLIGANAPGTPIAYSDGVTVMYLTLGAASGVIVMPPDIWLSEGWTIGAIANFANPAVPFAVNYLEEDAYGL